MKDKIPAEIVTISWSKIAEVHIGLLSKYFDKVGLLHDTFFLYNKELE